jgi:hypothetical protein
VSFFFLKVCQMSMGQSFGSSRDKIARSILWRRKSSKKTNPSAEAHTKLHTGSHAVGSDAIAIFADNLAQIAANTAMLPVSAVPTNDNHLARTDTQ